MVKLCEYITELSSTIGSFPAEPWAEDRLKGEMGTLTKVLEGKLFQGFSNLPEDVLIALCRMIASRIRLLGVLYFDYKFVSAEEFVRWEGNKMKQLTKFTKNRKFPLVNGLAKGNIPLGTSWLSDVKNQQVKFKELVKPYLSPKITPEESASRKKKEKSDDSCDYSNIPDVLESDPIDLSPLPTKQLKQKTREMIAAVLKTKDYNQFHGKRLNIDRTIISTQVNTVYRLMFNDTEDGLIPFEVIAHKEFDKKYGAGKM